jgi:hypothetical protein
MFLYPEIGIFYVSLFFLFTYQPKLLINLLLANNLIFILLHSNFFCKSL